MPGRPCQICSDAVKMRIAAEMISASDQAVADRIGGVSRMAVARHRQNHIEKPAKAIVEAANKGKDVREERDQLVAAAEAGDVAAAFLSLERIASDLRRVQERLERTADAAEGDNQRLAVASVSGQQLRAAEVRAKLGGVGGYATPRSDKGNAVPFVLNIRFSDHTERIEGTPVHPDDFDTIPPAHQKLFPVPPTGDLAPRDADEDDGDFDEDV